MSWSQARIVRPLSDTDSRAVAMAAATARLVRHTKYDGLGEVDFILAYPSSSRPSTSSSSSSSHTKHRRAHNASNATAPSNGSTALPSRRLASRGPVS